MVAIVILRNAKDLEILRLTVQNDFAGQALRGDFETLPFQRTNKMTDQEKSKEQLLDELAALRHRIAELERTERELKQSEEALRESEEQYRTIVEAQMELVCRFLPYMPITRAGTRPDNRTKLLLIRAPG